MITWVNESRNQHRVKDVIECISSNNNIVSVKELDKFIKWQGGHPSMFKNKSSKLAEVLRILYEMVEEGY